MHWILTVQTELKQVTKTDGPLKRLQIENGGGEGEEIRKDIAIC
jgi:hypothetical protein